MMSNPSVRAYMPLSIFLCLQLIPITARNSNGIRYELVVNKAAVSATAESQVNWLRS
jgi:hypothetical protein